VKPRECRWCRFYTITRPACPTAPFLKGGKQKNIGGVAAASAGAPHPRFSPQVELLGGNPRSQLDLSRIGEALSRQGLSSKEPPPCLLHTLSQAAPLEMKACFTRGCSSDYFWIGGLLWMARLSVTR
jgi:hypothetical protein